jgi:hypothetical protein
MTDPTKDSPSKITSTKPRPRRDIDETVQALREGHDFEDLREIARRISAPPPPEDSEGEVELPGVVRLAIADLRGLHYDYTADRLGECVQRLQRELDEAKSENHRWWKAKDDAEWRELEIREKYERLKDAYDESLEVREKLEAKIAHLSNPENWEVEVTESAVSKAAHAYYGHTGYSGMGRQKIRDVLHAARPKLTVRPSDSTEVDDGESVEGVAVNIGKASLRVELGYWTPDWLRHGTRVRITRLLDEVTP